LKAVTLGFLFCSFLPTIETSLVPIIGVQASFPAANAYTMASSVDTVFERKFTMISFYPKLSFTE